MGKLTQDRLKELLDYNPITGIFTWKISRGRYAARDLGGGVNVKGYRRIRLDGKKYLASRLAWLYMEGYFPENQMDHINRIRDDDRWVNLRHVSAQCNTRNSKQRKDNISGVTGVYWHTQHDKWGADIQVDHKRKYLGYFKDFTEAVKAR